MNQEIYEQVKQLAEGIVQASIEGNTKITWDLYGQLKSICEENESEELNHPFQWETLADFTTDDSISIKVYEKALQFAEEMELSEYSASIKFSMAERYSELGLYEVGVISAKSAFEIAKEIDDIELLREIEEYLASEQPLK